MTPDLEIWALALWVEKDHGDNGSHFIANQIGRLALDNDAAGVAMWEKVAERFEALNRLEKRNS